MKKEEITKFIFDHYLGGYENVANTVSKDDSEDEKLFNSPETRELALKRSEVRRRILGELVKFVSEIDEYADIAEEELTSSVVSYESGPFPQIIKTLWKLYLSASKCKDIDKLSTLLSNLDDWFERVFNYSKNLLNLPVPENINELLKDKSFNRSFTELILEAGEEITDNFEDVESVQNFLSKQATDFKNLIDELDQLAVGL